MRILGTTIEINRGEVFTLRYSLADTDGVPYMIPDDWKNPYLVITVASTIYRQKGRWSKNYWLDLSTYPKFRYMKPVAIASLDDPPPVEKALYYIMQPSGEKEYYYYENDTYKPYKFTFSKTFLYHDTKQWIESIHRYQLKVASGQCSRDWLTAIFTHLYPESEVPTHKEEIARQICKVRPELLEGVDWTAPIVNYEVREILRQPAKIIVRGNV